MRGLTTGLKRALVILSLAAAIVLSISCSTRGPIAATATAAPFTFSCRADNDLYAALVKGRGAPAVRFDAPGDAVAAAPEGGAVLLLADGYPDRTTPLSSSLFEAAARKRLRLYVEFPSYLPGQDVGTPRGTTWERAVVSSDAFGPGLETLRILAIHGCRFVPARAASADIVMARVAGYDRAVYGLPAETSPILFELPAVPGPPILVSTTKLSQFVTGRYGPSEAWSEIWRTILRRLVPGEPAPRLEWTPAVRPSFGKDEPLPPDGEIKALRRGIEWFVDSRMILNAGDARIYDREAASKWPDRVGPAPRLDGPAGDGRFGVLEGFSSSIYPDGSQDARWWRRHDCTGETAGAFALAGAALRDDRLGAIGAALADFLYGRSIMTRGERLDPGHPAFGLIGWNDIPRYYGDMDGYGVYYGDDNARGILGMASAAAALRSDRWDERLALALLGNLRVSGRRGFQPDRIDEAPLEAAGWRAYFESDAVSLSPHFQSYMLACYLWAYARGGDRLFLERAESALRALMDGYPDRWTWTNGMRQEQARMLLPLAWLVRVADTPEHRGWLRRMAEDVRAGQDACGALREELGRGTSGYAPPATNEAYGTAEASLLQANGDPVADLLYTTNFAFLGMHEAAAATGEPLYRDMEDRLAAFLCRAQVRSESHPELDGAWFRAFDFRRWEAWASSADAGWGAWSVETGWTQAWIASVLAMRRLGTSLWDLTKDSRVGERLRRLRPLAIPIR